MEMAMARGGGGGGAQQRRWWQWCTAAVAMVVVVVVVVVVVMASHGMDAHAEQDQACVYLYTLGRGGSHPPSQGVWRVSGWVFAPPLVRWEGPRGTGLGRAGLSRRTTGANRRPQPVLTNALTTE